MFKKIIFLLKSEASIKIILLFLFQKIINILSKKKTKNEKKLFLNLVSGLKISTEFFSVNAYNFYRHLSSVKSGFKYLEIGSFEGISSYFISEYLMLKEIYCVDTWEGSPEHHQINFKNIELNFDNNSKDIKNLKKFKTTSDDFFIKNKEDFDIIYVDGLHTYNQVKKDLINALKALKSDGIIICDDYLWNLDGDKSDIPVQAINEIVREFNLKIIAVTANQIFLKNKN